MIKTKQLHIGYSSPLLSVDDFELGAGVYILIGQNGSGKSTFLKTVSGVLRPVSGSVTLEGSEIHKFTASELPQKVAFVRAQFPVVDFLKVSEYLALGRSPHTTFFGKLSTKDKSKVDEAIETLEIAHLRDRFTNELSDGERQMVAIARTFAQETPVITLDEPTAFLDYRNKTRILHQLLKLGESYGKCIILSSHDIDQSVNSGADFLVVNQEEKRLQHLYRGVLKEDLIQVAFK